MFRNILIYKPYQNDIILIIEKHQGTTRYALVFYWFYITRLKQKK